MLSLLNPRDIVKGSSLPFWGAHWHVGGSCPVAGDETTFVTSCHAPWSSCEEFLVVAARRLLENRTLMKHDPSPETDRDQDPQVE
jgi:hypothetical protein